MARTPFSVFNRPGMDGKNRFYARFLDPDTGAVLKTVALYDKGAPVRGKAKAIQEAARMHDEGIGSVQENPRILEYCLSAWTPDSEYVKSRVRRGVSISAAYIYQNAKLLKKHLGQALKGVRLQDLTAGRVERILMDLADQGVNPRTINTTLQALRVPIRHFCKMNRIPDPLQYVQPLKEAPKARGALSFEEVRALIALEDVSPRTRAAFLLAALCGLRLGETCGLKWEDVNREAGILHVRGNYVKRDGFKKPKWSSFRDIPLPSIVLEALDLCGSMPEAQGSPFILYNDRRKDVPAWPRTMTEGFSKMLDRIGLDQAARAERNISFHSLRHSFVSMSRAAGLPDFVTQRLAGHRSAGMMERYSHAEVIDFAAARLALEGALKAAGRE